MLYLKADTVTEVTIGPAVAVGDGFTPVTTLTIASADEAHLMKHNNTTAVALAGTLAVFSTPAVDGYYTLDLSATETDTEGRLVIVINDDSLILPLRHEFMVVNANVFDSMFAVAGTDKLQVDVTEQVGTTVPAPATAGIPDVNVREWLDTGVAAATAGIPDTNPVRWNNGLIPAQGITGVPEVDVTHFVATLAPTPATAGVPDVNAVEFLDTAVVLSNGLPDVNVENWLGTIVTAATAGRPDVNAQAIDDNANAAAVLSDSLQDGVIGTADSGSTTSITDAARTEADDRFNGWKIVITSGLSAGQSRIVTEFANTGGVITFAPAVTVSLTTETYVIIPQAGVDLQSWLGTEAAMAAPNALVGGAVDSDVSALQANVITAAAINAAAFTAAKFAAGAIDANALATDAVNEIRDSIISDATTFAGANIDAAISSRATPAQVNTEVSDVLKTDTISELGVGVPAATPTFENALMLMYMALRNKLDVATVATDTLEIHNDAGTRIAQKLLTDDGTDYSEAKMISGA